jgi:hypothetical protein
VIGIVDVIAEQERSLNESLFTLFERLNYISSSKTGTVAPPLDTTRKEDSAQD